MNFNLWGGEVSGERPLGHILQLCSNTTSVKRELYSVQIEGRAEFSYISQVKFQTPRLHSIPKPRSHCQTLRNSWGTTSNSCSLGGRSSESAWCWMGKKGSKLSRLLVSLTKAKVKATICNMGSLEISRRTLMFSIFINNMERESDNKINNISSQCTIIPRMWKNGQSKEEVLEVLTESMCNLQTNFMFTSFCLLS